MGAEEEDTVVVAVAAAADTEILAAEVDSMAAEDMEEEVAVAAVEDMAVAEGVTINCIVHPSILFDACIPLILSSSDYFPENNFFLIIHMTLHCSLLLLFWLFYPIHQVLKQINFLRRYIIFTAHYPIYYSKFVFTLSFILCLFVCCRVVVYQSESLIF